MSIVAKKVVPIGRQYFHSVELTPNGKEILVAGFPGVLTIDLHGKEARRYRKHVGNVVWAARMSRDGKRVAAGNGGLHLDVWDAKTKKRLFELETDDIIVTRLSLSRDGKRAVTAACNNTLRFWDIVKGKCLGGTKTKKSFVIAAASSPDGSRAMYGGTDGVVRVFDLARDEEIAASPGKGWIESIECSDEGTYASGGRDKTVMLWDEKAKPIRTLRGFSRGILCVAISPDGKRVAATGGGSPMIWDAKTGKELGSLDADKCVAVRFSSDGASIVALGNDDVRIYDTP